MIVSAIDIEYLFRTQFSLAERITARGDLDFSANPIEAIALSLRGVPDRALRLVGIAS
jgi:hypothetical protein